MRTQNRHLTFTLFPWVVYFTGGTSRAPKSHTESSQARTGSLAPASHYGLLSHVIRDVFAKIAEDEELTHESLSDNSHPPVKA